MLSFVLIWFFAGESNIVELLKQPGPLHPLKEDVSLNPVTQRYLLQQFALGFPGPTQNTGRQYRERSFPVRSPRPPHLPVPLQPTIPDYTDEDVIKLETWAANYLSLEEMALPIPHRTGIAMKRMFRQAELMDTDVGPAYQLTKLILEDPNRPLVTYCGTACRFFLDVIRYYGYDGEMVSLCRISRADGVYSTHEVVQFSGPGYGPTFFDPLYGAFISNKVDGTWAGVADIITSIAGGGDLSGYYLLPYVHARHPNYEKINQLDYEQAIYPRFFNAVTYRTLDSKQWVTMILNPDMVDPASFRQIHEEGIRGGRQITILVVQP